MVGVKNGHKCEPVCCKVCNSVENRPLEENKKSEAIMTIDNSGHKLTKMTYAQALK